MPRVEEVTPPIDIRLPPELVQQQQERMSLDIGGLPNGASRQGSSSSGGIASRGSFQASSLSFRLEGQNFQLVRSQPSYESKRLPAYLQTGARITFVALT